LKKLPSLGIIFLLLTSAFLTLGLILVKAESYEWKDDFNYVSLNEMEKAGWIIGNRDYTDVKDGYVILDNDGSVGSYLRYRNFPYGIYDWKAESKGMWIGRSYGSLHIIVETERHTYSWWGDGYYPEFVFSRDEAKVFRFSGYQPKLNEWFTFTLEKRGNILYMYFDGKLMKTYVESDESPSAIKGIGVNSAWIGKTKYDYVSLSGKISEDVNEARKTLYENYAKLLNNKFWEEYSFAVFKMFREDFMNSFTNPFAILKKFATSMVIGDYSNAELVAKELGGLISDIKYSDVSFTIDWAYYRAQADPIVLSFYGQHQVNASQEMLDILSLIQQNRYDEAKVKIRKLIYYLQVADSNVAGAPTFSPMTKQSVKDLFESALNFLRGELHCLLSEETSIKLVESEHKLYLHVYDAQGNHVGVDQTGKIEIKIEGATYIDIGKEIEIILPTLVINFTYKVDATHATQEKEQYNITIITFKDGKIASTLVNQQSIGKNEVQEFSVRILEDKKVEVIPIQTGSKIWPLFLVAVLILAISLISFLILRKRLSSTSTNKT